MHIPTSLQPPRWSPTQVLHGWPRGLTCVSQGATARPWSATHLRTFARDARSVGSPLGPAHLPPAPLTSHRRSCASSVWQGAGTRHWPKPREPLLRCASTYLSMHHEGSPCIPVRPPRALPTTSSHSRHAASQKRPPRVETGKTGATQSISKAVRGLPIVERRGSIVPGLHRVP